MNVALYARVSTRDGRQDTQNQLIQLREYCHRQGWTVYREYVDQASGGTANRPEFKRLFADAHQRRYDVVLFWSLDRFSREGVRETLNHLERLTAAGVGWKSFTEDYLDSCGLFKDAVVGILAVIAKQERIRRSERATAAIERLRKQGKTDHLGRPRKVFDRAKALELRDHGLPLSAIRAKLGGTVSITTIHRTLAAAH